MWIIGAVVSMLTYVEVIKDIKFVYFSLLTVPMTLLFFCVLNVKLLKKLFQNFEFVYIVIVGCALAIMWTILSKGDAKIFPLCMTGSLIMTGTLDASPPK